MPNRSIRSASETIALEVAMILVLVALAVLTSACSSIANPTAERMTFAQMQALNQGVSGDWVLYEHPYAREVTRDPATKSIRRLSYWVEDPRGDTRPLMLHFDERGVLARKQYGGPIIRPPQDDEIDLEIGG